MFLHTVVPDAVALTAGPLTIYWYGIIMALAMAAALYAAMRLARRYALKSEMIIDAAFWMIIAGLIGARLYDILLYWKVYTVDPLEMLKIWHGGLAIHGALIGGVIALLIFAKVKTINAWKLAALMAPAVAIGQAIGRWGNWFNQELFGRPTTVPWGIPIDPFNRPVGFETEMYFHPTFLYESFGNLVIFIILIFMFKKSAKPHLIIAWYCILYGLLRFALEFIKIDATPAAFGLRWPQVISLVLVLIGILISLKDYRATKKAKS